MKVCLVVASVTGIACDHGAQPLVPDAPDMVSPDAAVVGMPFRACGASIDHVSFPEIPVGQLGRYTVDMSLGFGMGRQFAIAGSPDFSVTEGANGGTPLLRLIIEYRPTTVGSGHAVLTANGTALPLAGTGVSPLPASPIQLDRVFDNTFAPDDIPQLDVTNQSSGTPLDVYGFTAPRFAANSMATTLQPGDHLKLDLGPPLELGCKRTTYSVQTSAGSAAVTIERYGATPVFFDSQTIAIGPTTACHDGQCDTSPITVSPMPPAGQRFVGWTASTGCDNSGVCTKTWNRRFGFGAASAVFSPMTAARIEVTVGGSAPGKVIMLDANDTPVLCERGTCSFAAIPGGVRFVATSPSTFLGWTGACTGTNPQCNVGTPTSDVSVGAMFGPAPGDVASLFPPALHPAIDGGGVTATGDAIVLTDGLLSRLTTAGAVVWSREVEATDVAVASSGVSYVTSMRGTMPTVTKVAADGIPAWSVVLTPIVSDQWTAPAVIAIAGANLAAATHGHLRVLSGADGSIVWMAPLSFPIAITGSPSGEVAVATSSGAHEITLHRYDPTGAATGPDLVYPGDQVALAYDASGSLIVDVITNGTVSDSNPARLLKIAPSGTVVFDVPRTTPSIVHAIVGLSGGDSVLAEQADALGGLKLSRYSPSGQLVSTRVRAAFNVVALGSPVGVTVARLAADPTSDRIAVIGSHYAGAPRPWVGILVP